MIYGQCLTWERGTIGSTGTLSNSLYVIRSDTFVPISGKTLQWLGATKSPNNVQYFSMVCQYDSAKGFLIRSSMMASDGTLTPVVLRDDCAFIKLLFGHAAATQESTRTDEAVFVQIAAIPESGIGLRRRALMIEQKGGTMRFQKLSEIAIESNATQISIPFTPAMQNCDLLWIVPKFTLTAADYLYYDLNSYRTSHLAAFGYTPQTITPQYVVLVCTRPVVIDGTTISTKFAGVFGFQGLRNTISGEIDTGSYIGIAAYTNTTKFNAGTVEVWGWG